MVILIYDGVLIIVQLDDPTPPQKLPCSVHTFVRPLDHFPPGFEAHAKRNNKGIISPMKNERMLLNNLLSKSAITTVNCPLNGTFTTVTTHKADPDIIIGHEFLGVSLDVLLHRMKELKADHWSRIGRFRRSKWPNIGKQGTNLRFLNGRMLCDLTSDGAKVCYHLGPLCPKLTQLRVTGNDSVHYMVTHRDVQDSFGHRSRGH